MPYTNNVPQGNQTIASTTDPIRNNFAFIETDLQAEHQFNGNVVGVQEGSHLKASMPNRALSPALPTGTNGIYFVSSSLAYYYDGTTNWNLNQWEGVLSGSYTPTSSSTFNNIALLPANKAGIILLYRATANGNTQTGQFCTSGTTSFGYSNRIKIQGTSDDYPVELNNNNAGSLQLQGRAFSGSFTGITYQYRIFYRPA